MKAIIIEDELPAQAKLQEMLSTVDPSVEIVAVLGSVKETILWLQQNPQPDIGFVDIQLSDDHSFEIFKQHQVNFSIIFTTAYDKYLLESFEFNTIDYLLKPITEERLKKSLNKVRSMEDHFVQGNLLKILNHIQSDKPNRIVGKKGTEFIVLDVSDIAYFFTEHKIVFAIDSNHRKIIVNKTITELESMLSPHSFFRLNRKYLCAHSAINKFKSENGKIKVLLRPEADETIYVSKETAPSFRSWIE